MKLNRRDLRRLIESVINEEKNETKSVPVEKLSDDITLFFGYVNAAKDKTKDPKTPQGIRDFIEVTQNLINDKDIEMLFDSLNDRTTFNTRTREYTLDEKNYATYSTIVSLNDQLEGGGFPMTPDYDFEGAGVIDQKIANVKRKSKDYFKMPKPR